MEKPGRQELAHCDTSRKEAKVEAESSQGTGFAGGTCLVARKIASSHAHHGCPWSQGQAHEGDHA